MTIYEQLHHAIFDGVDDVCTEESSNIELLPIELSQEEFYESIDMNETINKRIEICLATECFSEDAWLRCSIYRAIYSKEIVNNDQSLRVDKTLRDIFRKTISQHGGIYAN